MAFHLETHMLILVNSLAYVGAVWGGKTKTWIWSVYLCFHYHWEVMLHCGGLNSHITQLPYGTKLHKVFLEKYFSVSKKLKLKDQFNNFVSLPGELVSGSWDILKSFMWSVPNYHIDDESLNEYFDIRRYDNWNTILDTIVWGYYGGNTFQVIAEKLEKISKNNKALGTRSLAAAKSTFSIQAKQNHPMMLFVKRSHNWAQRLG